MNELDIDDLNSILLALRHFPTWFEETAAKVERMIADHEDQALAREGAASSIDPARFDS